MPYKRPRLLEPMTPESMQAPGRRRRAAVSCLTCRERKVKCDRNDPCSYCVENSVHCRYRSLHGESLHTPSRLEPPAGPASESRADSGIVVAPPRRRGRPRRSAPLYENPPFASAPVTVSAPAPARVVSEAAPVPASVAPALLSNASLPSHDDDSRQDAGVDHNNVNNSHDRHDHNDRHGLRHQLPHIPISRPSSAIERRYGLEDTGWSILKQRLGLRGSDIALSKTRIPRWSEWMGTAPEFSSMHGCFTAASSGDVNHPLSRPDMAPIIAEIREYLQKARTITKSIKSSGMAKFSSISAEKLKPPPRDTADAMVALYIDNFESAHRILHIPSFYSEYEKYWSAPLEASAIRRWKVLLVVAIGTSLHASFDTDPKLREQVYQWVCAARDWLALPWEKPRLDVEGIQVQCLTYIARQIFATGGDTVWESMGTLINAAKQVNLHRDPRYLPKMSVLQIEVRRRLWHTILELEMHASLDTAMAARLSTADFDTEAPSNVNDSELDEAITVLRPSDNTAYTQTSLQLLLLSTAPIRLQILNVLNGLHSKFSYAEVLTLSQDLIATHSKSVKLVHYQGPQISAFKRNLVEFLVRRYLLPLHCPFASLAETNPLFHYSRKTSIDAAMTILCPESDQAYSRLLRLGGNFLREGLRCAATALCTEVIALADAQRSDFIQVHAAHMASTPKKALRDVIQLSAEQIKRCDRNIKLHMFLSMVQAHIKSTAIESAQQMQVARAGRDSLILCHGLLQTSFGMAASPAPEEAEGQALEGGDGDGGLDAFNMDWDFGFFVPDTGYFRQFG